MKKSQLYKHILENILVLNVKFTIRDRKDKENIEDYRRRQALLIKMALKCNE